MLAWMTPTVEPQEAVHLAHPLGVALGQVVVHRDQWAPLPARPLRYIGIVATRVLPSPVFISAMSPSCSTMPPMTCTSKGRMPKARARGFARDRESFEQQVVQQFAVLVALAELRGLGGELLVRERRHARLERVDLPHLFLQGLEPPAFTGAQQLVDDLDHRRDFPGQASTCGKLWTAQKRIV